jgi:hypothetical protein
VGSSVLVLNNVSISDAVVVSNVTDGPVVDALPTRNEFALDIIAPAFVVSVPPSATVPEDAIILTVFIVGSELLVLNCCCISEDVLVIKLTDGPVVDALLIRNVGALDIIAPAFVVSVPLLVAVPPLATICELI